MSPLNENIVVTPKGVVVRGKVRIVNPVDTVMTAGEFTELNILYREKGTPAVVDGNFRAFLPPPSSDDSVQERQMHASQLPRCEIYGPPVRRYRPQLRIVK